MTIQTHDPEIGRSVAAALAIEAGCSDDAIDQVLGTDADPHEDVHSVIDAAHVITDDQYSDSDALEAASSGFSTASLSSIMSGVIATVMVDAYKAASEFGLSNLALELEPDAYRETTGVILTTNSTLDPVAASGEVKAATISEEGKAYSVGSFANVITLPRQVLRNAGVGFLSSIGRQLAVAANRTVEQHIAAVLNAMPVGTVALDEAGLSTGVKALRDNADYRPTHIASGTDLEVTASKLCVAPGSAIYPLSAVASSELTDGRWYLAHSSAATAPVCISYVGGSIPKIEQAEAAKNVLGTVLRVSLDFGVAELDANSISGFAIS